MRYKFQQVYEDEVVTLDFDTVELAEMVAKFEAFLLACGFAFHGHLDFVEDEDEN